MEMDTNMDNEGMPCDLPALFSSAMHSEVQEGARQEYILSPAERVAHVIRGIGTASVYSSVEMSELLLGDQGGITDDQSPSVMPELEAALRQHPAVEAVPARTTRTKAPETIYKIFPHPEGRASEDGQELAAIEEMAARLFALTSASWLERGYKVDSVAYFLKQCEAQAEAIPGAIELLKDPASLRIVKLLAMQHMHATDFSPSPPQQPASPPSKSALRRRRTRRAAINRAPTDKRQPAEKPKFTPGERALQQLLWARTASIAGVPRYLLRLVQPGKGGGEDRSFKAAMQAAANDAKRVRALPRGCYLIVGKEDVDNEAQVERYVSMAAHLDEALEVAYYAPVQNKALTPGLVRGILHKLMGDSEADIASAEAAQEQPMILSLIYSHPWWVSRKDHNSSNKIVLPIERLPAGRLQALFKNATAEGPRVMSREAILAEINPLPSLKVRVKFDKLLDDALEKQPGFVPFEVDGVKLYRLSPPEENRPIEEGQMQKIKQAVNVVADRLIAEEFLSVSAERCIQLARVAGADLSGGGLVHVFIASLGLHPALTPRADDPTLFDIALPEEERLRGGRKELSDASKVQARLIGSDIHQPSHLGGRKIHRPRTAEHRDKYAPPYEED